MASCWVFGRVFPTMDQSGQTNGFVLEDGSHNLSIFICRVSSGFSFSSLLKNPLVSCVNCNSRIAQHFWQACKWRSVFFVMFQVIDDCFIVLFRKSESLGINQFTGAVKYLAESDPVSMSSHHPDTWGWWQRGLSPAWCWHAWCHTPAEAPAHTRAWGEAPA